MMHEPREQFQPERGPSLIQRIHWGKVAIISFTIGFWGLAYHIACLYFD